MGDPLWPLLNAGLHLSGSHGSTSFPDVKGHTFTRSGAVAISTAQSRFAGEGSAYFPGGASDRLSCAASADFIFTGATSLSISFSLYLLAYPAAGNQCRLINFGTNGNGSSFCVALNDSSGKQIGAYVPLSGKNNLFSVSNTVDLNVWQDFEISVFNGTALIFKNGLIIGSLVGLNLPTGGTSNIVRIGGDQSGFPTVDAALNGYLSELRILCKWGRHDSAYALATGPFEEGFSLNYARSAPAFPLVQPARPAWKSVRQSPPALLLDAEHGGRGRIVGTTQADGDPDYPVSRRVRLLRQRDSALAREIWSDADGNYAFDRIRHDVPYVLMSHDHTGLFNAVIADGVIPELIS
ncbi:MAG: hypothetical protein J5X22_00735 [Candidatus Accumulibacter sp.]|uniref:LamG-like jellyroll fold domain-containing protein n=1 Tax=Accumulibacter sp. TaxID=2053492 RepID=UPI001AD2F07A|nr:LamG-like jellyroll fold domain-containing protein [Accumulibacter sp.]MBN8516655.1 hypothetical protein [Accumulibacter sp.]MBO3709083.1 hypothetical protein [Accumulibacter sp.]